MSRIGKNPVPVPDKVTVSLNGLTVTVKGPKGELQRTLPEGVSISQVDSTIVVSPTSEKRQSRERHGLCRALVANMIEGVSNGYSKSLEIIGVGSRAQVKGKTLVVSAGYSHPVEMDAPEGITFKVDCTLAYRRIYFSSCVSFFRTFAYERTNTSINRTINN